MANSTVGIRLDEETQERLKKLGKNRDRTPHYLMKEAVAAYLVKEEAIDQEDALLQARWDKFALTGESLTQGDMENWLDTLIKSKTP